MRTSWVVTGAVGIASALCLALVVSVVLSSGPASSAAEPTPPPVAPTPPTAPALVAPPATATAPQSTLKPPPTPPVAMSADETAIRRVVAGFAVAYNKGDAKGIAALFTPEGEIVAEDGATHQGRAEIEEEFSGIFKDHPQAHIDIQIESIRFVSPTVAVEIGGTSVMHDPQIPAEHDRYEVIHVKQGTQWQMASARDLPDDAASGGEQLKQLAWLIGDWVDESPDSVVMSSYHWTDDKHFIVGEFTMKIEGRPVMSGTQRIGWDPVMKKLRSWAFDSEGGFMEGSWSREGNNLPLSLLSSSL